MKYRVVKNPIGEYLLQKLVECIGYPQYDTYCTLYTFQNEHLALNSLAVIEQNKSEEILIKEINV